ncbi:T9SS type A sorting domain-containing protein [uncultured Psychroserpens sp.]|uniref:T9SS type A sorting domain-containing protein n=1 Tax=uncultured Psychroserpens sp. TaxID=255436 RepID=UPI00260AD981|nr:T9SS type A sorting domain-containing protein [uncultured Psychroserpens sp.]
MKHITLLFLILPFFGLSQIQIGQDIDGEAFDDVSGSSIALNDNGDIVAICGFGNDGNGLDSGHVRIFENQGGSWTQIGSDINGESSGDGINSVALNSDGSIIAVGATGNDGNGNNSGHVRIYENQGGAWTQIGSDIDGDANDDNFGSSISMSSNGTIVAIGASGNDGNGNNSGHVRIYENQGGIWIQIGQDINGENPSDLSGGSVSINSNGTIVAIGATGNDGNGSNSGHVRIYENQGGAWIQIGSDIDGEVAGDRTGQSVSLNSNGTIVAIGASGNDGNGSNSGHVRIYENQGGTWTQIGVDIDGEASNDNSGASVALSSNGTIVAIGASGNDGNGNNSGHVRIYENQGGTWTQIGIDIDGEVAGDQTGQSVSLNFNGTIVATGAPFNNGSLGSFSFTGHVRVYDLTTVLSTNDLVLQTLQLYPNPAKIQFTIQLDTSVQLEKVTVYNLLGQEVLTSKEYTVNTSKLSSGSYVVEVITNQGKSTKQLIID